MAWNVSFRLFSPKNLGMYIYFERLIFFFCRGAEVNIIIITFTGFAFSIFLIHLFSRSYSSFIIKIRNTSSVFSGEVNQ